jgi:hypothetical protein
MAAVIAHSSKNTALVTATALSANCAFHRHRSTALSVNSRCTAVQPPATARAYI